MAAASDEPEAKRARRGATAVRRRWSSAFLDDLLAVVYGMVASPRGRARFAAVCRLWRAAARVAPPTAALPWLLLETCDCSRTKHLHCPEDGAILRMQLPSSRRLVGCHDGGWVISTAPLRIVNLFSGAAVAVALPEMQWRVFRESRIIFSKPPTLGDCILATMTESNGIALCRVDCPDSACTIQSCRSRRTIEDITFCNDELYEVIIKFNISMNEDGAPVVTAEIQLSCSLRIEYIWGMTSYIFVLRGKLAMAVRTLWSRNHEPFFKVFELVDNHDHELAVSYKHKWTEVTSLGDHAVFLGRTFSKAVHVPADKCGHVERNHIYYTWCLNQNDVVPSDSSFLTFSKGCGDYGKKDYTSDDVKMIKSTGYFVKANRPYDSMWILPPDM